MPFKLKLKKGLPLEKGGTWDRMKMFTFPSFCTMEGRGPWGFAADECLVMNFPLGSYVTLTDPDGPQSSRLLVVCFFLLI